MINLDQLEAKELVALKEAIDNDDVFADALIGMDAYEIEIVADKLCEDPYAYMIATYSESYNERMSDEQELFDY